MFNFNIEDFPDIVIKIIGVGGGGNNAVNRMVEIGMQEVEFIAIDNDRQDLNNSKANFKIWIDENRRRGLGQNPKLAQKATEESCDEIATMVGGADMVFVIVGMGGCMGTVAAPVVAQIAKDMGILTIGIVTMPFTFEGQVRMRQAEAGIEKLKTSVDSLIIINNDRLLIGFDKKTTIVDALEIADDVLRQGIQGISYAIKKKGLINIDFADVKNMMKDSGLAHMGIGIAKGDNKVKEAVMHAINSPLLEATINSATGVLLNITSGTDINLLELDMTTDIVEQAIDIEADIKLVVRIDDTLGDEIVATVIATGFDKKMPKPKIRH